jgi:succinate dehydrogenase/fumarate reductase flavoprotein subunit
VMWRQVGVERSAAGLGEALEAVEGWCRYVLPRQFADPRGWQLQNMLEVARLMIRAAIARRETRGVHFRADHAESRVDERAHLAWRRGGGEPWREPVADAGASAGLPLGEGLPTAPDGETMVATRSTQGGNPP